jgi:hypothetical protein
MIKTLRKSNPLYNQTLKAFNRWSAEQHPHHPGMIGQTETQFPCKAAYAVTV